MVIRQSILSNLFLLIFLQIKNMCNTECGTGEIFYTCNSQVICIECIFQIVYLETTVFAQQYNIHLTFPKRFIFRLKIGADGKIRKLVIDQVTMDNTGTITAKTNADKTPCPFEVKRKHAYVHSIIYLSLIHI